MIDRWLVVRIGIFLLSPLLAVARPATAQTCTYNFQLDYEQLTRLTDEFDATYGDGDSKTELIPEGFRSPTDQRKEIYYVTHTSSCPGGGYNGLCCAASTDNFFRTYDASFLDYRDSPLQNDAPGYATDALLGCPYTSQVRSGLAPMARYYKAAIHDYKTWLSSSTPSGYALDAEWPLGNPTPRLAYQRFGNLLDKVSVETAGFDAAHTFDNGVLKMQFNKIWGDMLGMITYDSTNAQIEYANPGEVGAVPGDGVQSVVRWSPGADCRGANPTQGGGANGQDYSDTTQWAGSPVVSETTSGTSPGPVTFTSVVRPLDFDASGVGPAGTTPWLGGVDGFSPLAWRGWIQRSDTLSCILGSTTRKDVIFTSSQLQLAEGYSGSVPRVVDLANTYWLAETPVGDFRSDNLVYKWVDLATGVATPFTVDPTSSAGIGVLPCAPSGACGSGAITPPDSIGKSYALVVSKEDGSFAYALVRKNIQGVSDYLTLYFHCGGSGCGASTTPSETTVILKASSGDNTSVTTGSWSQPLQSYLVVNNLSSIMTRLSDINGDNGSCVN